MKKYWLVLLLVFSPSLLFAWGVMGVSGGVVASSSGTTYLINQNFEGTGYDNGESWTDLNGSAADPDYTTSPAPLRGSQSWAGGNYQNTGSPTFTSSSTIYCHFLFSTSDTGVTSDLIFRFYEDGSDIGGVKCSIDALIIYVGGDHSSVSVSDGTVYHIWIDAVSDGTDTVWSLCVGAKGTADTKSSATCATSYTESGTTHDFDQVVMAIYDANGATKACYDQILVSTTEFTTVEN